MMKKIILFFTLQLIFLSFVNGQSEYFSKKIDLGNDEIRSFLHKTSDGLILYSIYDKLIYKLDTFGNFVWKRKIGKGIFVNDVQYRNDTIFITALKYKAGKFNPADDMFFVMYNTKGDSLNTVSVGNNTKYESYLNIRPTRDGNLIFAVSRASTSIVDTLFDYDSLVVFKTDIRGKLLWEKKVSPPSPSFTLKYYQPNNIYETQKGEYYFEFLAHIKGKKNVKYDYDFSFSVQFNDKGVFKPTKMFPTDSSELFFDLIPTSDGRFFGTYSYDDNASINMLPSRVILMDKNLNYIKKEAKLGQILGRQHYILIRKELSNHQGFIGIGMNENHDSLFESTTAPLYEGGPWIAKFNKDAVMEWDRIIIDFRYIDTQFSGLFWGVAEMGNGGFILSGDIYRNLDKAGTNDLWLVRLDSMGCPYPNCKGRLQVINSATDNEEVKGDIGGVKIIPNPTSGILWFEVPPDLVEQEVHLLFFDLMGKVVFRKKHFVTNSVFNLDVDFLENGLYLVKIQDKAGRGCTKKILKQD